MIKGNEIQQITDTSTKTAVAIKWDAETAKEQEKSDDYIRPATSLLLNDLGSNNHMHRQHSQDGRTNIDNRHGQGDSLGRRARDKQGSRHSNKSVLF